MRLQADAIFVGMTEFSHFRTSWHTIGTLDWGELPSGFSNSDLALHVAPRPLPIPLSLITSAVLYAGAEDNR